MSDTFQRTKAGLISISVIFVSLAILYFTPVQLQCKLALPVGFLFLASLWLLPWQMSLAMLFSCIGDYCGATHNFPGQMGAFALAHIAIICYFLSRYRVGIERKKYSRLSKLYIIVATVVTIPIVVFAFAKIVPHVPEGFLTYGVSVYIMLIAMMLWCAMQQRSLLFASGAMIFLVSDTVLAWNRFVEHIPNSGYIIMITYYLAQLLLFMRSTKWWGRQMKKE